MKEKIVNYIEEKKDDLANLISDMIKQKSINPYFVQHLDEKIHECKIQEYIKNRFKGYDVEIYEVPVKFEELQEFKDLPGYKPGVSDQVSFEGRNNLLIKLPGTDPENYPSVLLSGHCDVVGVEEENLWKHPPFEGVVDDKYIHGRGSSDMLGGLGSDVFVIEALLKNNIKLKGDVWLASVVSEEFGGTGALAVARYMREHNIRPDVGIMSEASNGKNIVLFCRSIAFVDLTVTGRSGHLEMTTPHHSAGGPVDAIKKARYIMDMIDIMNEDWALRPEKDSPLLRHPCQARVSMIKGGHHPSSFSEKCVISLDIQSMPVEQDKNGLPMEMRREFEDYIKRACEFDPWLRDHPVEIDWKLDADCVEISPDHKFVKILGNNISDINSGGELMGIGVHYDGGWFQRLNGTPMVCFGPGDMELAHSRDEKMIKQELIDVTKAVAMSCIDWCGLA